MKTEEKNSKEERILRAVKMVLTNIARETATAPEIKHPLSDQTLSDMRQCLFLISEREKELTRDQGQKQNLKPLTPADRAKNASSEQRIPVSNISRKKD